MLEKVQTLDGAMRIDQGRVFFQNLYISLLNLCLKADSRLQDDLRHYYMTAHYYAEQCDLGAPLIDPPRIPYLYTHDLVDLETNTLHPEATAQFFIDVINVLDQHIAYNISRTKISVTEQELKNYLFEKLLGLTLVLPARALQIVAVNNPEIIELNQVNLQLTWSAITNFRKGRLTARDTLELLNDHDVLEGALCFGLNILPFSEECFIKLFYPAVKVGQNYLQEITHPKHDIIAFLKRPNHFPRLDNF